MITAYLSLGSNIGDRLNFLRVAIETLDEHKEITVKKVSPVYETLPWGNTDQGNFYNLTIEIGTTLMPHDLLRVCQQIESDLERVREIHWGPRTIDIDILLYGEENVESPVLVIPHPLMHKRDFVMVPLNDIAPEIKLNGVSIQDHFNKLSGEHSPVKLIDEIIR